MTMRGGGSAAATDTSRRTFRGRGGPTDRRLPKHQARRRKQVSREEGESPPSANKFAEHRCVKDQSGESEQLVVFESKEQDKDVRVETDGPAEQEIQHLLFRVRNVRESVQLSAAANATPSTWQQNVLNAVQNCVGEWRSIVNHYQEQAWGEPSVMHKEPALAVFGLMQMAMQSGPLAGAKPGYFKRCGSDVAQQALQFLNSCVRDKEDAASLYFTEKQTTAIDKWKSNAAKASENEKPPSKSAMKKQQSKTKR